jgi:hypothetical protein
MEEYLDTARRGPSAYLDGSVIRQRGEEREKEGRAKDQARALAYVSGLHTRQHGKVASWHGRWCL